MNPRHPFSILLLMLLATGILSVCFLMEDRVSGTLMQVCGVDESLEQCGEDPDEETVALSNAMEAPDGSVSDTGRFKYLAIGLGSTYGKASALCSFGWMLPLRI